MSPKAKAAWEALKSAMTATTPACAGDDRFVSDELTEWERVQMRGMCRNCPLASLCGEYAAADKPTGGFWAGTQRIPRERNTDG